MGRVLDDSGFNGFCRQAFDQNTGTVFRMPYNLDEFNFQVFGIVCRYKVHLGVNDGRYAIETVR